MKLHYVIGDALEPIQKPAFITHCNNDEGGWGRGFVVAISKKWSEPEMIYRNWYKTSKTLDPTVSTFKLGNIQLVPVEDDIHVINMIAQHSTVWIDGVPPIRYDALEMGLKRVQEIAAKLKGTVHMPRIGADLAGGDWNIIEKIILKTMRVDTYVYTLESQKDRWPTEYEGV
jgi:O-acetyl-ADP-ribose deacetylase (regulator of RNase III)